MGIESEHVLSDDNHVKEFLCVVCSELVELNGAIVTHCNHVFCKACLDAWLERNARCPTCNSSLELGGNLSVDSLKQKQPVAWRVLSRVRVQCPLRKEGCTWKGDYGDLMAHLTSAGEHNLGEDVIMGQEEGGSVAKMGERTAEGAAHTLKEQGNSKFAAKQFAEAVSLYSKAISLSDLPVIHANRAAAYYMLRQYKECIHDCDACLAKDPSYAKAYVRKSKALSELGMFQQAADVLEEGQKHVGQEEQTLAAELKRCKELKELMDVARLLLTAGNFAEAKQVLGAILREVHATDVILCLARAELGSGLIDKALRLTLQAMRMDSSNPEAYSVRSEALLLHGQLEQSLETIKGALRVDPDHSEAKQKIRYIRTITKDVTEARRLFNLRSFQEAEELYSASLNVLGHELPLHKKSKLNAMLHAERAACRLRLKDYNNCLKDCALAIYAQDDLREGWLTRAKALHALGRHEEALEDMENIMQTWGQGDPVARNAYETAVFEVRKAKRPNYYEELGVPRVASEMEIKKQYKQKALEWHPDRWSAAEHTEEERKQAEAKFKRIGEALEVLTEPFKRQLYDEGYDKKAIEERVEAANRAAHDNRGKESSGYRNAGHHGHNHSSYAPSG